MNLTQQLHHFNQLAAVHGVCSAKPRSILQNSHSKGSQYWRKDVWHIRKSGTQTICGVDSSEWLDMGMIVPDNNLCDRCQKKAHSLGIGGED